MSDFVPLTVLTSNVMQDLKQAALSQRIAVENLDFDLLSYETSFKGSVDEEWQFLQGNDLLTQTTENEIRSNIFLLRQEYQIQIRLAKPHPYLTLDFTIATDKTKSRVIAIINPSSKIPLVKGVQEWIKYAIKQKMLRNSLMIGLYDQNLDREIQRLIVKIQKEGPLKESYRLPIGEFFLPIMPINDKIVLHYKNANVTNSMIEGVNPGDLILEYIFPKPGRHGRACTGEHINVPEPIVKYASYVVIDPETISSEQDEESIRFFAKVSGYVDRKQGMFYISQELQIENASFKKTGSIETGIEKDISLIIKKNVHDEDAVGTGINIDVQKLDVSGTIGRNAKIQACELKIGAQTHRKSEIHVSETANVHLHRGNLKAKDAHINILESGKVEADTIQIQKMMGGEVIGRKVHVHTLYSNARIIALESITIDTIEGDGNNLIINPHAIASYHQQIIDLEAEIKAKATELYADTKQLKIRKAVFVEKNSRIKEIQIRVLTKQKRGEAPMKADLVRLQQYKSEREAIQEASEQLVESEQILESLKEKLEKLYEADIHAVVTHRGVYNGHNRIVFIDPKNRQEYGVSPEGAVTHIRLRKENDEKKFLLESE